MPCLFQCDCVRAEEAIVKGGKVHIAAISGPTLEETADSLDFKKPLVAVHSSSLVPKSDSRISSPPRLIYYESTAETVNAAFALVQYYPG